MEVTKGGYLGMMGDKINEFVAKLIWGCYFTISLIKNWTYYFYFLMIKDKSAPKKRDQKAAEKKDKAFKKHVSKDKDGKN